MSPIRPAIRVFFFDKSSNAFLGIVRHHVLRHDFRSISIGFFHTAFELAVERLFANFDRIARFIEYFCGYFADRVIQLLRGYRLVDEAVIDGALGRKADRRGSAFPWLACGQRCG